MQIESRLDKHLFERRSSIRLSKWPHWLVDISILIGAFHLAYLLRFDFDIPAPDFARELHQLRYVVPLQLLVIVLTGVHAFIWRYIGLAEATTVVRAAVLSAFPLLLLRLTLPVRLVDWSVPLSVIVMDTTFAFGILLGVRVCRRAFYERNERRLTALQARDRVKKRVLLIGAGRAGVMVAREIQNRGDLDLQVVGFVDDDPNKQHAVIHGIKVLGATADLRKLVTKLGIDHVVISITEASRREMKGITDICERIPVKARIVPGMYEILQDKVQVSRIRDVQIEDLLGRPSVVLDQRDMQRLLECRTVAITGAGGSIGSELARQVCRFEPSKVLLIERSEFALFNVERELRRTFPALPLLPLLADVGDEARMRSILSMHRPQVIIHAAAHKHVPMMELNPTEAIENNVLATNLLGELAGEFNVEVFALISTDKAVRPTSVMGASKRLAELLIQGLNDRYRTRYVAVRFGNVIGSTGSVVPIFKEQIAKGGPVTVTHPDVTRYFMTIPEAAQLVLQAAAIANGGEIFILDMGEPVRILDIAKDTIRLSGLKPFEDIDIEFTGLRPGEKLFEELEITGEQMIKTRHRKIFVADITGRPRQQLDLAVEQLACLARMGDDVALRLFLNDLLPEARLEVPTEPTPTLPTRTLPEPAAVPGILSTEYASPFLSA
jgi:FlaA1/EpsC-like NDP-sugar epimerase